ncbi:glycosyltransferase [Limosilactobacillus agrestis]|nr:glycosyltransferase family 2 protein [Limosilactobacillus agrestis]MCD7127282.1 glycosyltransferase [Limosilactobacillus agrestis]
MVFNTPKSPIYVNYHWQALFTLKSAKLIGDKRINSMEKVSVIIPIYNKEKYLTKCIDSVLEQTYSNLEIILVDDGSTDRTAELCERYYEKYDNIRVLHKKKGGIGSSRNAGLAMATGDYILFVDSDDWLDKKHIELLYNHLKKNNADIAIGSFNQFNDESKIFEIMIRDEDYFEKVYSPQEWFAYEYVSIPYQFDITFTVPWGKLYKRSLFRDMVYPEDPNVVEDDLTTWKIYLLADKIVYINKPIYVYRTFNKNSITAQASRLSTIPLEGIEERISLLNQIGFDVSRQKKAYSWRLHVYLENALKDGNYSKYRDAKQKLAILKKYNAD